MEFVLVIYIFKKTFVERSHSIKRNFRNVINIAPNKYRTSRIHRESIENLRSVWLGVLQMNEMINVSYAQGT